MPGASEKAQGQESLIGQSGIPIDHDRLSRSCNGSTLLISEPPGRHVLKLCRAEACQAAGGDALAARAQAKLGVAIGNTASDRSVTFEPIYCLGLCATAPAAMLDGRVVGRLDAARLDALLDEARR
jgi:NADH:ubiquinone oxidoreductase subunit E